MTSSKHGNATARLYQNWLTGLVLSLLNHAGEDAAEAFVFSLFRNQHLKRFLPGLKKLGLDTEPDAIAAAKYHYFSNQVGGVKVEYLAESERKAWVRYPPPRWIWDGTAICAIPTRVNVAMMRGWHAHNGVSLGNPRLGFVCTGMTTDAAPGLEGYYQEFDTALADSDRLQFAPHEQCPPIDPAGQPRLASGTWPPERLAKANLNYAMEYLRNALPLLEPILGREQAAFIGNRCARQTGMHSVDLLCDAFGIDQLDGFGVSSLIDALLQSEGSQTERDSNQVKLTHWRLFDQSDVDNLVLDMFTECLAGMQSVIDRFARLNCQRDNGCIVWTVSSN